MSDTEQFVFYRLRPHWGLPSLSIACIQVEAYLRLANLQFAVQECPWGSFSPSGQVPALDTHSGELIGANSPENVSAEWTGAKDIIAYLKKKPSTDLDRHLSTAEAADVSAYSTLIEAKILPALLYSTWCESEAFSKLTRPALGAGLPFPLNFWLVYAAQSHVRTYLAKLSPDELYEDAEKALEAISRRLLVQGVSSNFFLGARPCSVDALLFACLAYIRYAPVVHPNLQDKVKQHVVLARYVDSITTDVFARPMPPLADIKLNWSVRGARGGGGRSNSKKSARKSRESEIQSKGRMWLLGAAAAIVGYVVLSGQYFEIRTWNELGEDDYEDDLE